ncbi:MAG: alkaline phosphatase family protein [Armatimonadota bacterium]
MFRTSSPNAPAERPVRHVVIVSFDGGKPEVMRSCRMPHLDRLRAEGAGTWQARTVYPSITLVSHTAMLTGVGPVKHGITWNEYQPEKGLLKVPTIFEIAKKSNKKWVTGIFAGKEKFATFLKSGVLDAFSCPDFHADIVSRGAADFIRRRKPTLTMVHFADTDGAGHDVGWGSDAQRRAFEDCDRALGRVVDAVHRAGIAEHTVVIVSADHGGHKKTHGSLLADDMTIPWWTWGATVRRGTELRGPVATYDTAATALWLLGVPVPSHFDGQPVREAYDAV